MSFFRFRSVVLGFVLLASLAPLAKPAAAAPAASEGPSLYKRLGGYDAIAAVTDDFVGRLVSDARFTKFFTGASNDSRARIRQHIVDQLCMATGGPCFYTGRSMKAAHAGLGITDEEWNGAVEDLVATLNKFRVPEKEQGELAAILATVKGEIVERK
jgi:hemoglobin